MGLVSARSPRRPPDASRAERIEGDDLRILRTHLRNNVSFEPAEFQECLRNVRHVYSGVLYQEPPRFKSYDDRL